MATQYGELAMKSPQRVQYGHTTLALASFLWQGGNEQRYELYHGIIKNPLRLIDFIPTS